MGPPGAQYQYLLGQRYILPHDKLEICKPIIMCCGHDLGGPWVPPRVLNIRDIHIWAGRRESVVQGKRKRSAFAIVRLLPQPTDGVPSVMGPFVQPA